MTEPDPLAGLDWTPERPQCECPGCKHHGRCVQLAAYTTELHMINECFHPGLTATGGAVRLLCSECVEIHRMRAQFLADKAQEAHNLHGVNVVCAACRRPLVELDDYLRIEELVGFDA